MMSTQQLIEKATITTDQIASQGKLNPQQEAAFLDYVEEETAIAGYTRNVRVTGEQRLIEKINIANRVAVPKEEAVDPGIRRGVTTSKVPITPVEIMVPFEIGDLFEEENLEGKSVEEHLMRMFARRFANNIEELHWNGNTVGPAVPESELLEGGSSTGYILDSYLALYNGFLKQAQSGHVVDAAGAAISPDLISRALNAMPNKFKRNKALMKFFLSTDHEQAYRATVSTRATATGDNALASQGNIPAYGVELVPVPLLDPEPLFVENSDANTDGSTATALSFGPITALKLTPTTLAKIATVPYILNTDYSQDLTAGTWTRLGAGAISSGGTIKATYRTGGQMVLTVGRNMIIAVGRDVRLERDRNIFRGVNEFALTAKVYCVYEETDAVVLVKNMAVPS